MITEEFKQRYQEWRMTHIGQIPPTDAISAAYRLGQMDALHFFEEYFFGTKYLNDVYKTAG